MIQIVPTTRGIYGSQAKIISSGCKILIIDLLRIELGITYKALIAGILLLVPRKGQKVPGILTIGSKISTNVIATRYVHLILYSS